MVHMFTKNCRSEILRATQKDDEVVEQINQDINDVLLKWGKGAFVSLNRDNLHGLATFLYSALTSLSNLQTLGEEYTVIFRTTSERDNLPGFYWHFAWLLLEIFGETVVKRAILLARKRVKNNVAIQSHAKKFLLRFLDVQLALLPLTAQINRMWFYFRGKYYDIPRRISRITYFSKASYQAPSGLFRILGITSIVTAAIRFYQDVTKNMDEYDTIAQGPVESDVFALCSFCRETPTNVTLTPCGHLFCWGCVQDLRNVMLGCPNCRRELVLSRNVALRNYI